MQNILDTLEYLYFCKVIQCLQRIKYCIFFIHDLSATLVPVCVIQICRLVRCELDRAFAVVEAGLVAQGRLRGAVHQRLDSVLGGPARKNKVRIRSIAFDQAKINK